MGETGFLTKSGGALFCPKIEKAAVAGEGKARTSVLLVGIYTCFKGLRPRPSGGIFRIFCPGWNL